MIKTHKNDKRIYLFVIILCYITINLLYLTRFPFMHSDETWLSGLSRNILQTNTFGATEPFFDLKIRHPHAIKILFHTIQIGFIKTFGYHLFPMRFISFIFGLGALYYFYKLNKDLFQSNKYSLFASTLLAMDVQFIYASHFARQEIILLFVLIFGLYYAFSHMSSHSYGHDIFLGILIGLSIGIHPNSFVISLPFGCIYLYHIWVTKRLKIRNLFLMIFSVFLFSTGYIFLSRSLDPNFISNYMSHGQDEFNVLDPMTSKVEQIKYFYLYLFHQEGGTYYTPNIQFQFYIFLVSLIISIINLIFERNPSKKGNIITIIIAILAINGGIIAIGRYNQTSIIFIFPLFYILTTYTLSYLPKNFRKITAILLIFIISTSTLLNASPYVHRSYDDYIYEISKAVPKDATVLANLNTEYYFDNGKLHDYRNLIFLKKNGLTFDQYIHKYKIQYIIYSEELDFIDKNRPKWNVVYGSLPYYNDMKDFLNLSCEEIYKFQDPIFGMSIAKYINKKDWEVRIYKVK